MSELGGRVEFAEWWGFWAPGIGSPGLFWVCSGREFTDNAPAKLTQKVFFDHQT